VIFFAISLLDLLDLQELELHGVERPKIVTMTFSVERSRLMSSTTPVKFVKGRR